MTLSRMIAFAISVLLTSPALATDVGGPIVANTTWTLAGSPYIVTNAIIVGGNATLTIDPGVTVKFNAGLGITIGSAAWGIGSLKAIGSASQKITFTSNTAPGQPGQWKDILFTDRTIDAAFDAGGSYLSGSILQHCIVEFAGGGASGSGAVTITQASPLINFCEVRNNARSGIYANNTNTTPLSPTMQIKNSNIHHNNAGSEGLGGGVQLAVNSLVCTNNTVSNNSVVSNNNTSGRGGGLFISNSGIAGSLFVINGNLVSQNTIISFATGAGGGAYVLLNGANATFMIFKNTFMENTITGSNSSYHYGGGLYASLESGSISGNNISGNIVAGGGASGGGLCAIGRNLTIQFNTISANQAVEGGGLWIGPTNPGSGGSGGGGSIFNLTGNTIATNQAQGSVNIDNGLGGGVYISNNFNSSLGTAFNFISNTFTSNVADGGPAGGSGFGGGLYVTEGTSYQTTVNLSGNQTTGAFNVISGNTADVGNAIYNNMLYADNGSNDIQAGYVCWGGLDPNPTVNPNLIYDFFDNPQKAFVIYPPHVTSPNCTPAPGCSPGLIADCNGHCAPISWISDAICDNGFYTYNGFPIYFNCQQFGNDGGACNAPPPPLMNPPNHGVPVPPPQYEPPSPPLPVQNKLILVTHGWNTTFDDYVNYWTPLRNVIAGSVGPDWKVRSYDWTADSLTGVVAPGTLDYRFGPDMALNNARVHGFKLGREIAQEGYQHVHLIAHSAGSGLIAAAATRIKLLSPSTTIHTTFLDAFAGTGEYAHVDNYSVEYGGNSDWSDHYYSREVPTLEVVCNPPVRTGNATQLYLIKSHNVDISLVDPAYSSLCLSSHAWPRCFYRFTVDGGSVDSCASPSGGASGTEGYGFPLSFEEWTGPGGFAGWKAARRMQQLIADDVALSSGSASGLLLSRASDPPVDLMAAQSGTSNPLAVQIAAGGLSMTTLPASAPQTAPAWVNFQLTTTSITKYVDFDMTFASPAGAEGLLTLYVNGTRCGIVDEKYMIPGTQSYSMPTPDLLAGQHIVSFRLDPMNAIPSNVTIINLATGRSTFVPNCPADFNGTGGVTLQDLFDFLTAWFANDPSADFDNSGGQPTLQDIFDFLGAWFAGCP